MAFPVRVLPATFVRPICAHHRMSLAGNGLFAYLRSRASESDENRAFDLGSFWSNDATCLETGSRCVVVFYLLFEGAEHMSSCLKQLERSLAVDADVYDFTPSDGGVAGHSAALLFSHLAPLVGPMTYGDVQRAVEHYLGWCSHSANSIPRWKDAQRATVELVPRTERMDWFRAREKAFSVRRGKSFWAGSGFPCKTPCDGGVVEYGGQR